MQVDGKVRPYRVLTPLLNQRLAADLLTIAQAMARQQARSQARRASGAEAIILGVAEVHDSSFSSARPLARAYRTLLNYMPPAQPRPHQGEPPISVYTRVTTAHSVAQGIIEAAREMDADLIILSWKGYSHEPDHIYGRICDEVMRGAPCDVLLARIGAGGLAAVREMLLAMRGGPYAEMGLRLGQALMLELDATLAVMHARANSEHPDAPAPWDEPFRDIEEELQNIAHRSLSAIDGLEAITEQLANHDLTIIGASGELHSARMDNEGWASTTAALSHLACTLDKSLLVAKTHQPLELMRYRRPKVASLGEFDVEPGSETGWSASVMRPLIERWGVENSYEVGEFADYARLVELKQRQGCRVSLVLLAEQQTHNLPAMLRGLQVAVQEQAPLVDEIVTLDGSPDGAVANLLRQQGFTAYRHDEILPEISTYAGHGCLLWKSAACTSGDLLLWLDLRAGRMISGSVAGLLGPLLEESGLQMVIGDAAHKRETGGSTLDWSLEAIAEALKAGRSEAISALCARFFPPLGGISEPNSYDLAIYRRTFERLPVVAGAWASVGLLLAVINRVDLSGLGQVELARPPIEDGQRLHHKAGALLSLIGRYLQSGAYRSGRARSIVLREVAYLHQLLEGGQRNPRRAAHQVELRELETWELPPLVGLPQYLERRAQSITIGAAN